MNISKFNKFAAFHFLLETSSYYRIIFWFVTLKAEFSSESPVLCLDICSIYVATTHLATIFYKKMEQIYKNRTDLFLWNSAFVTDQKIIWQLPGPHRSVKVKPKVMLKTLNANYIMK